MRVPARAEGDADADSSPVRATSPEGLGSAGRRIASAAAAADCTTSTPAGERPKLTSLQGLPGLSGPPAVAGAIMVDRSVGSGTPRLLRLLLPPPLRCCAASRRSLRLLRPTRTPPPEPLPLRAGLQGRGNTSSSQSCTICDTRGLVDGLALRGLGLLRGDRMCFTEASVLDGPRRPSIDACRLLLAIRGGP